MSNGAVLALLGVVLIAAALIASVPRPGPMVPVPQQQQEEERTAIKPHGYQRWAPGF
jgi:hypothetical protein